MKAPDFLNAGLRHMQDRAATYDKPSGERSMTATVGAFNALTGHALTEQQGWLMMALLKCARSQQGAFRADNYEDLAAYAGLMGEAAHKDAHAVASLASTEVQADENLKGLAWWVNRAAEEENQKAARLLAEELKPLRWSVPPIRRSDVRFADISDRPDSELERAKDKTLNARRDMYLVMRKLGWGEVVNNEVPQGYRVFQTIDGLWWCAPSKAADPPEEFRYRNEDKL